MYLSLKLIASARWHIVAYADASISTLTNETQVIRPVNTGRGIDLDTGLDQARGFNCALNSEPLVRVYYMFLVLVNYLHMSGQASTFLTKPLAIKNDFIQTKASLVARWLFKRLNNIPFPIGKYLSFSYTLFSRYYGAQLIITIQMTEPRLLSGYLGRRAKSTEPSRVVSKEAGVYGSVLGT